MLYPVRLLGINAKIAADPADHIAKILKTKQFYEADLLEALMPHLQNGDVVVDVGAHVGNHSAFFEQFNEVIAVEPCPKTAKIWKRTMRESGAKRATLCESPAGAASGQPFAIREFSNNTGRTQARPSKGGELKSVTVDQLVGDRTCAVLKIDVEGHEPGVIVGAAKTLRRSNVVVAVEAGTEEALDAVDRVLSALGYKRGKRYCATPTYIYEKAK